MIVRGFLRHSGALREMRTRNLEIFGFVLRTLRHDGCGVGEDSFLCLIAFPRYSQRRNIMGPIFLVCHGAWSAGWAWKKMHPLMAASGHRLGKPPHTRLGEGAPLG